MAAGMQMVAGGKAEAYAVMFGAILFRFKSTYRTASTFTT